MTQAPNESHGTVASLGSTFERLGGLYLQRNGVLSILLSKKACQNNNFDSELVHDLVTNKKNSPAIPILVFMQSSNWIVGNLLINVK